MKIPAILVTIGVLALSPINVVAHGVLTDVKFQATSVVVKTLFSEAIPVVGATVTIFSPAASEVVWQSGQTDLTGSFAFLPDIAGDWVFIVDDQKGHAKKLTITIPDDFLAVTESTAGNAANKSGQMASSRERIYQTITGLALIFGITGIFYGVRLRQTSRDNSDRK